MENSELIYVLTNSEKLKHEEYKYEQMEMDGLFLSQVQGLFPHIGHFPPSLPPVGLFLGVFGFNAFHFSCTSFL